MKNNKYLPYVIFGVPIAIALYFVYKAVKKPTDKKKKEEIKVAEENNTSSTTTTTSSTKKSDDFPLKKGSYGAKVIELQNALIKAGQNLGKSGADGDFGNATQTALNNVLGKTTADSQADIDAIYKKIQDQNQALINTQVTQTRGDIGQKLVDMLKADKSLDFKALHDTQVDVFDATSDGRYIYKKTVVVKEGGKVETSGFENVYVGGKDGFIYLLMNINPYFNSPLVGSSSDKRKFMFRLSPYGFKLY